MNQITTKQFLELSDLEKLEYSIILEHTKGKSIFEINSNNLTYNEVRTCSAKIKNGKGYENAKYIFINSLKITEDQFYKIPITDFFITKNYIIDFFVNLHKQEQKLLSSIDKDSVNWKNAGGERLNEFSDTLPLTQLAKLYGGYPFDYGEKKYIEIIYLLRLNMIQTEVEFEYQKIKSKN